MTNQKECFNCGEELKGEYCYSCGQKVRKERLSVKYLLSDFFSNVFNAEKGAIPTTLLLLKSPEVVVKDFIKGKTQSYVNPFKYIFFLATISAIVASFIDFGAIIIPNHMHDGPPNPKADAMGMEIVSLLRKYFTALQLLMIPLYAWVSYRIYKKEGYNYAEHVVMVCYLAGFMSILSIFGMIPFIFNANLLPYFQSFILLFNGYYIFAFYRIGSKKGLLGILKALWFVVLFYVLMILFSATFGVVWVLVKEGFNI